MKPVDRKAIRWVGAWLCAVGMLCAVVARAADVVLRQETWTPGSTAGWGEVDGHDGLSVTAAVAPDGAALRGGYGAITIPAPEPDGLVCGPSASGGIFAGDLFASGYVPVDVGFDCLAEGRLPSFCCVRLRGGGETNVAFFAPVTTQVAATGVWMHVSVPLRYESGIWHGGDGSGASFSNALHDVQDFEIGVVRRGEETQSLLIDNFAIVLEVPADVMAVDTDHDGLPDYWEEAWFGGATNAVADRDSDGDRMSNADEYTAGTDPTDSNSVLRVEGVDLDLRAGAAFVRYNSVPERQYRVDVSRQPRGGTVVWTALTAWVEGRAGYGMAVHTNAPAAGWYRLKARRP